MSTELIFGKYEILRRVAVGGMGEIFLARQTGVPGFERLVILKSLRQDIIDDEQAINAFLDEARIAALISHPNVVQIFEVGKWEGTYFLAMEYIRGESLAGLAKTAISLKAWPPPLPVCLQIMSDAAIGLDHAHHAKGMDGAPLNIVHRDVSPQNIMVSVEGITKLVDFGIAKAANRESQTAAGIVKGKMRYMPPEQLRGEEVDARTDQFALGVVFWELLSGKRLFGQVKSEIDMLRTLESSPIAPPSSINSDVPKEVDAALRPMLALDPSARYPRCLEFASCISDVLRRHVRGAGNSEVAQYVELLCGEAVRARTQSSSTPQDKLQVSSSGPARNESSGAASQRSRSGPRAAAGLARGSRPESAARPKAPGRALAQGRPQATPLGQPSAPESVPAQGQSQATGLAPRPSTDDLGRGVSESPRPQLLREPLLRSGLGGETSESRALSRTPTRSSSSTPLVSIVAVVLIAAMAAYVVRVRQGREGAPRVVEALQPSAGEETVREANVSGTKLVPVPEARAEEDGHRPLAGPSEVGSEAQEESATVFIDSTPQGAGIFLENRALGTTPAWIRVLAPDTVSVLSIEKPGYVPATLKVVPRARETVRHTLALHLLGGAEVEPEARAEAPGPGKRPSRSARAEPPVKAGGVTTSGAENSGLLTVNTTPWAQVTINGRSYGSTPIFKMPLPAGTHSLQLTNEEEGIRREQKITIRSGEITKLNIDLKK